MDINWNVLYQQMKDSEREIGWPSLRAKAALEIILGEDLLRQFVDDYITDRHNTPLVRDILWFLQPWSAMQRCYEVYQTDADMEHRRAAVFLFMGTTDHRALPFIESLLADPDAEMQKDGASLLDRLFYASELAPDGVISGEAERIVRLGEVHLNEVVREWMASIRRTMNDRRAKS